MNAVIRQATENFCLAMVWFSGTQAGRFSGNNSIERFVNLTGEETDMRAKATENSRRFELFRKRLVSELKNYQDRIMRARQEVPVDSEPEDDMGLATRSSHREMTMGNLERYFQTTLEIERALARIEAGQYDTCVGCRSPSQIKDSRHYLGPEHVFSAREEGLSSLLQA